MPSSLRLLIAIVLCAPSLAHARKLASRQRKSKDFLATQGVEHILCKLGPVDGYNGSVQVWADSQANTRGLAFMGDGLGEQTLIQCKGSVQAGCGDTAHDSNNDDLFAPDPPAPDCSTVECPCEADTSSLQFSYMKLMMNEISSQCQSAMGGQQLNVLLIGLGGGALFNYVLEHCPGAHIDAVEYDPRVMDVATRFFGVKIVPGKSTVETADGGVAVEHRATRSPGQYDIVLIDCFQSGGEVPPSCRSDSFINNLQMILRDGGRALQNIWCPQYEKVKEKYQQRFGKNSVKGTPIELGMNNLIVATKSNTDERGQ